MRKKINSVTITLYIIFFALAIICGVLEPILPLKMWIGVIVFLALMVLVALLRYFLLLNENKKAKKSGAVRVVDVQPSKVKGTVISSKAISEKVPLVHVDDVNEKKVVVSIYKEKVLATDSVGKVIK